MRKAEYKRTHIEGHNKMRLDELGGLIREYRRNTMLSRKDFAKEFDISKGILERIENGKNVEMHSILRICDILFLSPKEIFHDID